MIFGWYVDVLSRYGNQELRTLHCQCKSTRQLSNRRLLSIVPLRSGLNEYHGPSRLVVMVTFIGNSR